MPFSVEIFYDRFFSENAVYSQVDFQNLKESWNIIDTPWENNKKTLECMVHVKNVPFCKQTRSKNIMEIIEKTPNKFILEIDCYALDAPYGDYFVIKDGWVVVGDENSCLF